MSKEGHRGNLRLAQSVHAASIYINARLFLRVRRIKPEGVASWQRGRIRNRNRSEPRLGLRDFDAPNGRTDVRPFVFPATVIATD
jgi:hypothetical protein